MNVLYRRPCQLAFAEVSPDSRLATRVVQNPRRRAAAIRCGARPVTGSKARAAGAQSPDTRTQHRSNHLLTFYATSIALQEEVQVSGNAADALPQKWANRGRTGSDGTGCP